MRCKLSLRQIEKYTAELWPMRECPRAKLLRLQAERLRAMALSAQMVAAAIAGADEQVEAAALALRSLMDEGQ